jgi:hypothetical protein
MKINYIGEVTRTEIFLQDITGAENLHANNPLVSASLTKAKPSLALKYQA